MQDQDACLGAESRDKASIFSSPDAQAAWRSYARLHTRLQPYFMALAESAHATGAPIIRHVFLEKPRSPPSGPASTRRITSGRRCSWRRWWRAARARSGWRCRPGSGSTGTRGR